MEIKQLRRASPCICAQTSTGSKVLGSPRCDSAKPEMVLLKVPISVPKPVPATQRVPDTSKHEVI